MKRKKASKTVQHNPFYMKARKCEEIKSSDNMEILRASCWD